MRRSHHLERVGVLFCLAALAACTTTPAATGDVGAGAKGPGAVADARPNTARGSTTAPDANVQAAGVVNVAGVANSAEVPAHKSPGGAASKSYNTCSVHFDSRNRLYIETYVDGRGSGILGPWGDVYTYAIAGPTRLYARASFSDGSVTTWGPIDVSCPAGGSYTWRLTYSE